MVLLKASNASDVTREKDRHSLRRNRRKIEFPREERVGTGRGGGVGMGEPRVGDCARKSPPMRSLGGVIHRGAGLNENCASGPGLATSSAVSSSSASTFFAGAGFIDGQGTTIVFLLVQGIDGGIGIVIVGHFNEAEAFAATGFPVLNDLRTGDRSELREQFFQGRTGDGIGQISNIQPLTHRDTPLEITYRSA